MTRKHRRRDILARGLETFDEVFFLQHVGHVQRRLLRMGIRAVDLDDLAQQTFVVAHRRWKERPRNFGRHRQWLEGIAWRLGMNLRRKRARRREILEGENFDAFAANTTDPESLLELRRIFDPTSDTLIAEDRAMLFAHYVDDMPLTELAAHFGLPRSTAWTRLQQIRHDATAGIRSAAAPSWTSL